MITDPLGEVYYENMPEGFYDLTISPLSNLEDLFFLHGEKQSIETECGPWFITFLWLKVIRYVVKLLLTGIHILMKG